MTSKKWNRRAIALLSVTAVVAASGCGSPESSRPAPATSDRGDAVAAVVYRSPTCGCCRSYEEYLIGRGFVVTSEVTDEMDAVKTALGIPEEAESCHTTVIGEYVIEGHVPVQAIEELLDERPDIDGIALPGMPSNSPGMGEPDGEPLEVLSVDEGQTAAFMSV